MHSVCRREPSVSKQTHCSKCNNKFLFIFSSLLPPQTPQRSWRTCWRSSTAKESFPNTIQSRWVCVQHDPLLLHILHPLSSHSDTRTRGAALSDARLVPLIQCDIKHLRCLVIFRWTQWWRHTFSVNFGTWRQQISSQLCCKLRRLQQLVQTFMIPPSGLWTVTVISWLLFIYLFSVLTLISLLALCLWHITSPEVFGSLLSTCKRNDSQPVNLFSALVFVMWEGIKLSFQLCWFTFLFFSFLSLSSHGVKAFLSGTVWHGSGRSILYKLYIQRPMLALFGLPDRSSLSGFIAWAFWSPHSQNIPAAGQSVCFSCCTSCFLFSRHYIVDLINYHKAKVECDPQIVVSRLVTNLVATRSSEQAPH